MKAKAAPAPGIFFLELAPAPAPENITFYIFEVLTICIKFLTTLVYIVSSLFFTLEKISKDVIVRVADRLIIFPYQLAHFHRFTLADYCT